MVAQWSAQDPAHDYSLMEPFGQLFRVNAKVSTLLTEIFRGFGIGPGEFDVLATLYRSGAPYVLTPRDLLETMMVTSGGLTGRLDRLERADMITRKTHPEDRRSIQVHLLPRGRLVVTRAALAELEAYRDLTKNLSAEDINQLNTILAKLG